MNARSNILIGSAVVAITAGLIAAAGPAAGASVVSGAQWARGTCPPGSSPSVAGYVDCSSSSSGGSVHFRVPGVPICNECGARFLVGLGGFGAGLPDRASTGPAESDGVLIKEVSGVSQYDTWWMINGTMHVVRKTVQPGDLITASVVRFGTTYKFRVTDSTHPANSFTKGATCTACDSSTVEWLTQAVPLGTGYHPVPDFGGWTVTGATATIGGTTGGISAFPNVAITMSAPDGAVLVQPGGLNPQGNGFTDTWEASG